MKWLAFWEVFGDHIEKKILYLERITEILESTLFCNEEAEAKKICGICFKSHLFQEVFP